MPGTWTAAWAPRRKTYRYSVNMQVVIDANTRLTVAVGRHTGQPQNDCRAYRASGVDRQQCHGACRVPKLELRL